MKPKEPTIAGLTEFDCMERAKLVAMEHMEFNPDVFKQFTPSQAEAIRYALVHYAELGAQQSFRYILMQ